MEKNMTDILRTKGNDEFRIIFNSQGRQKNAPSIYPALRASILIRNDSLTSDECKAKNRF